MNKLNTKQIKQLNKKLALPTVRTGSRKQIVPPKLTEAELNFLIFVSLAPVREANGNKFVIKKNWNKMSKSERAEQVQEQRLARGEGTTGSQPMNT